MRRIRLRKAGCEFFALQPAWAKGAKSRTPGDVVFFLNPLRQDLFRSGTFTVDELIDWSRGRGAVLKDRVQSGAVPSPRC